MFHISWYTSELAILFTSNSICSARFSSNVPDKVIMKGPSILPCTHLCASREDVVTTHTVFVCVRVSLSVKLVSYK